MNWKIVRPLLLGSLFCFNFSQAQNFFENNTKYYYEGKGNAEYPRGYFIVERIELDSIIDSTHYYTSLVQEYRWNILRFKYSESEKFIQEKSKVFLLRKQGGQTLKLLKYDFEKNKGDTMYLNYNSSIILPALVDSVEFRFIGKKNRKVQFISIVYNNFTYKYEMIEGLGCFSRNRFGIDSGLFIDFPEMDIRFPCVTICINGEEVFKSDSTLGLATKDCMWDTTVEIKEIFEPSEIKIYPNPAQKQFNIQLGSKEIHKIEFFNSLGKKLDEFELEGQLSYSLSCNYKQGVYYIKVTYKNAFFQTNLLIR